MKKHVSALMALSVCFAVACNNTESTDSTKVAEEKNEQKLDSAAPNNNGTMAAADSGSTDGNTISKSDINKDQDFMVEAASDGLMEVELGSYAAQNAASAKVKQFGARMAKDHTKANAALKSLATTKNISIPATPGNEHLDHINDMKAKKGVDFDKAYMSMMVDDHEEDVKKFQDAADNAKDADIKAFALKTLPVLKEHHELAKSIHDGLK